MKFFHEKEIFEKKAERKKSYFIKRNQINLVFMGFQKEFQFPLFFIHIKKFSPIFIHDAGKEFIFH